MLSLRWHIYLGVNHKCLSIREEFISKSLLKVADLCGRGGGGTVSTGLLVGGGVPQDRPQNFHMMREVAGGQSHLHALSTANFRVIHQKMNHRQSTARHTPFCKGGCTEKIPQVSW